MADQWLPILLSAKVFGHLSQGLYRTPAGAIKELVSNSFDADATLVRIHTGFPRFETFSCEDNGAGMSMQEFKRLVNRGIGSSYKRTGPLAVTSVYRRPLIGRLGLGILSLAQICTRFEIVSYHEETQAAFRATIEFPPYTRQEMDKVARITSVQADDEVVHGGKYQTEELPYDSTKRGVRVFTKYLRESFRKRMRSLAQLGKKGSSDCIAPYRTFEEYLDTIYRTTPRPLPSLNVLSDYDQLLFGLALAPPLPLVGERNLVAQLPNVEARQKRLQDYHFEVQVDTLSLRSPVCLPSDREGNSARRCSIANSAGRSFDLHDGSFKERCSVAQHRVAVANSDLQFNLYELQYSNSSVAGTPLSFKGYLFQQTGRLYPRDVQGILIRLNNVAIGKYDNSMLTYPYAEGPRYSMISSELFVERGFEDALNIDRDSFNELHPHYIRAQAYIHSLLHELIFPETWGDEKVRNKARRVVAAQARDAKFIETYRKTTGDKVRAIQRLEREADVGPHIRDSRGHSAPDRSPVEFELRRGEIEIDWGHPLLQPLLRRRKYASVIEKLVVAFERANQETAPSRRRDLFYKLLAEIFSDL